MDKLVTVLYEWGSTIGNLLIGLYIVGTLSVGGVLVTGLYGIDQLNMVLMQLVLLSCLPLLAFAISATSRIQNHQSESDTVYDLVTAAPLVNWVWFIGVAVAAPLTMYYLGLRDPIFYSTLAFFGMYALTDTLLEILISMNKDVVRSVVELLPEEYSRDDIYDTVAQIKEESESDT